MPAKVPAAQHTLNILKLLIQNAAPMTAVRIATELQLPRSTTYQLLAEMVDSGFVVHLKEQRRYGLGAVAYSMAQAYVTQQPLVRACADHMQTLAAEVSGSAHLSRLSELEVSYLSEERAPGAVSLITDVGVRLPALTTASGKAMLAALDETELKARVDAAGEGKNWRQIKAMVNHVQNLGWASELEEVSAGQRSIAVAIIDHAHRPAAALAITFRVDRYSEIELMELAVQLRTRVEKIQVKMFGRLLDPRV